MKSMCEGIKQDNGELNILMHITGFELSGIKRYDKCWDRTWELDRDRFKTKLKMWKGSQLTLFRNKEIISEFSLRSLFSDIWFW